MFAAVRSTRQWVPNTLRLARAASTVPTPDAATTSTPAPTPTPKALTTKSLTVPKPRRRVSKVEKAESILDISSTNWEGRGLKYDPATLPLKQTLDPNLAPFTEEDYAMTLIHGRSVSKPFFHPRTHDIPVANVHFRSHHVHLLNLFTHFATHAAAALGLPVSQVASLPTQRRLWTVLRGPFAHKKAQENFERRVHKRAIKAWDADPEVVQRWVAYLRTHAMPGVGMKVVTWERMPLHVGAALKKEAVVKPSDQIASLGKKIVKDETVSAKASKTAVATSQ
ncbi:hypothetical protein HYPSUDRAFT_648366 [Hypholoma sublateritium FD-334 SS-4]|uniref:Small ribosomal subunit protein uS10m n=1 Tax=Hypholoma sublateritium (strain FD-334 SS-4) TaxID=945553 RepID=A0A0D2L6V6_HYPSF|nr:hypothetical protein HYPSUDRAFT_648366 [Hypholoma sublateritium FD-334 SS-4]